MHMSKARLLLNVPLVTITVLSKIEPNDRSLDAMVAVGFDNYNLGPLIEEVGIIIEMTMNDQKMTKLGKYWDFSEA
jgi:hypothetical protein